MAVNTANWAYNDWRSQSTVELQLAAAKLHDAEVRQACIESAQGAGRFTRLQQGYLEGLAKEIQLLERQVAAQSTLLSAITQQRSIHFVPRV